MSALDIIRIVSAVSWGVPFVLFLPSAFRRVFWGARAGDVRRASAWFVACVFIGFIVRWLVWPSGPLDDTEYATWCGLYVLGGIAAQNMTWAMWDDG